METMENIWQVWENKDITGLPADKEITTAIMAVTNYHNEMRLLLRDPE